MPPPEPLPAPRWRRSLKGETRARWTRSARSRTSSSRATTPASPRHRVSQPGPGFATGRLAGCDNAGSSRNRPPQPHVPLPRPDLRHQRRRHRRRAGALRGDGDPHARCELVHGRTYAWDEALRAAGRTRAGRRAGVAGRTRHPRRAWPKPSPTRRCRFARSGRRLRHVARARLARPDPCAIAGRERRRTIPVRSPATGRRHLIAERTGSPTVADFRRRDVAAGGHGARCCRRCTRPCCRRTARTARCSTSAASPTSPLLPAHGAVRGFDTGPANALMDAWCERHTGRAYDANGDFAASGTSTRPCSRDCSTKRGSRCRRPKSTGREQFHLDWLASKLAGDESPADVQATLLELSAAPSPTHARGATGNGDAC